MPSEAKRLRPRPRRKGQGLNMPVMGMESEFNVWLDGVEINPETYWHDPKNFIDAPLLPREKTSSQLPTGGAVYFDRGVIEVVTPVIELAPGCSARVVRNIWEQIGFVRGQLTQWGERTGHDVRLKAYSAHYNISFELTKAEQSKDRNIQKLALLLGYILPVPVALLGGNRRSTGVGVRPREDRIEITSDFTPDPGLMIATATLLAGVVRGVMAWPSYDLSMLDRMAVPVVAGVVPGKHTTRKGWLAKDFHFPRSPFTSNVDARLWDLRGGGRASLRQIARRVAWIFRHSIRRYADPFSLRLLFNILDGHTPSMLELPDRPGAYEDVGRSVQWGMVLPALQAKAEGRRWNGRRERTWATDTFAAHKAVRAQERTQFEQQVGEAVSAAPPRRRAVVERPTPETPTTAVAVPRPADLRAAGVRSPGAALAEVAWRGVNRRATVHDTAPVARPRPRTGGERRVRAERRVMRKAVPFPDRRLTRSAYEQVFLKLVSGQRLRIEGYSYTPVGMTGWYHAKFRRDADGRERLMSIDQLLDALDHWF